MLHVKTYSGKYSRQVASANFAMFFFTKSRLFKFQCPRCQRMQETYCENISCSEIWYIMLMAAPYAHFYIFSYLLAKSRCALCHRFSSRVEFSRIIKSLSAICCLSDPKTQTAPYFTLIRPVFSSYLSASPQKYISLALRGDKIANK